MSVKTSKFAPGKTATPAPTNGKATSHAAEVKNPQSPATVSPLAKATAELAKQTDEAAARAEERKAAGNGQSSEGKPEITPEFKAAAEEKGLTDVYAAHQNSTAAGSAAKVVPIVSFEQPAENAPEIAPLDERLRRLNELTALQTKFARLQASKTRLAQFKAKNGYENLTLKLIDNQTREEFSTSNPLVILEQLEFLKATTEKLINETAEKIVW